MNLPGLPLFASLADGCLHFQGPAGEEIARTAVEVKTRGPFVLNTGPEKDDTHAYIILPPLTRLSPSHIAQAHAHMLVLRVRRCIVCQLRCGKFNVFVVEFDHELCSLMFLQLQQIARLYIIPKVFPPVNFGDLLEGRLQLIFRTLQLCEAIKVHAQLDTVKGKDSVCFLPVPCESESL